MATLLSNQQSFEFAFFLSILAIALGATALVLWLCFWIKVRKLEKRMYRYRQHFQSRPRAKSAAQTSPKSSTSKSISQSISRSMPKSMRHGQARPQTMVPTIVRTGVKQRQHRWQYRWRWLLAIAIASITGIAIAMMQMGNGWMSPELTSMIWVLIGVLLVASATFVEVG